MYKLTQLEQFNGVILLEDEYGNVFHEAYNMNVPVDGMHVNKESALVIASVSKLFFKQVLLDFEQSGTISLRVICSCGKAGRYFCTGSSKLIVPD
ncbi:MAG: hypothetical protein AAF135_19520, partial [Bacteroidota bacterium]